MRNDEIRVIKRIKNEEVKETKIVLSKNESKIRDKIGNVVKDWISERRENSRMERLFSESNILAWQISTSKLNEGTS